MVDKKAFEKLISKGLTGKEAGKMIIQDSWLVDRGQEGFLSERDINNIKYSLKKPEDIQTYNNLIETYRIVDFTLKQAHILALEIQRDLLLSSHQLETFHLENRVRWIQLTIPSIVTQKQYEELKEKQRERRLKEVFCLREILDKRAQDLTPDTIEDEWMEGDEEGIHDYLFDHLQEKHPDIWRQTVLEILEVIRQGRIRPVQITGKDQARLERVWKQIKEAQSDYLEEPVSDKKDNKLRSLHLKEEKLLQELYQAGSNSQSQESLISSLEKLQDGLTSEDESYKLLEYTYCPADDLYQAGLPEWIQSLDKYIPNLDEETAARPVGMMQSNKVAIIQDPDPEDVNERGYYKDPDHLGKISGLERKISKDVINNDNFTVMEYKATEQLKVLLAYQVVIEAVAEVVGVDFTEDMSDWLDMTETVIDLYNIRTEDLPTYLDIPKLKPINLNRLKPARKTVRYIQERMAISLGEGWQDAREALIQDLKEKEAQDGQK